MALTGAKIQTLSCYKNRIIVTTAHTMFSVHSAWLFSYGAFIPVLILYLQISVFKNIKILWIKIHGILHVDSSLLGNILII